MAITTRLAGTACPVTVSGSNVTFAGWDFDWEWYGDIVLDTWVVYNVTRTASLVIHTKTGTEGGGYTLGLTGDASAWQTGDLCFVSNSATVAVHATIAALKTARGYLDTAILAYATATYGESWDEDFDLGVVPIHIYGHLSRQRVRVKANLKYFGDQSANTTQVVWRNVTVIGTAGAAVYLADTGVAQTGGGAKVRRVISLGNTFFCYKGAAGTMRLEFCVAVGATNGFSGYNLNCPWTAYHCVALGCGNGFVNYNTNAGSVWQNCAAVFCTVGYLQKTGTTLTKCADFGGSTGSGDLDGLTKAQGAFWRDNNNGFFGHDGVGLRILTASSLVGAGTYVAGMNKDIDGNTITDGVNVPVGIHVGTATPYGITHPTASNVIPGTGTYVAWDGTKTPSSDKLYSAAEEAARNTDPGEAFVLAEAEGGPASYLILNDTKTPAYTPAGGGGGVPVFGGQIVRRA